MHTVVNVFLHGSATLILIGCTIIELFFFGQLLLTKSIMGIHDWSYGQFVGITIWTAVIVDLVRHEIGMLKPFF